MPIEMRPRRPTFAMGGGASIASSGGPVPAPPGGAPGAVSPMANRAPAVVGKGSGAGLAPPPSIGGHSANLPSLAGPSGRTGGAIGGGALGAPLGGTQTVTPGSIGGTAAANARQRTNIGQLGGGGATNTTNLGGAPLSHGSDGGGTARTTTPINTMKETPADVQNRIGQASSGRPMGSNALPQPRLPGAIAGPGAQGQGQGQGQTGGSGAQGRGENYDDWGNLQPDVGSVMSDQSMRATIGLYSRTDGSFQGQAVGTAPDGHTVYKAQNGTYWADTPQGWRRESGAGQALPVGGSSGPGSGQYADVSDEQLAENIRMLTSMANRGAAENGLLQELQKEQARRASQAAAKSGEPSPYGSTSSGQHAGSGQDGGGEVPGRRYSNAGGFGSSRSGLSSSGGGSAGSPAGTQANGQPSNVAVQLGQHVGQDPWLIQQLLDMGFQPGQITADGVEGISDPDFGPSGDAEWDDMFDPEAGQLYQAGRNAESARGRAQQAQAQSTYDQAAEQAFNRIKGLRLPTLDSGAVQGAITANRDRYNFEQSRALGAHMAGSAAAGLSPEAQQGGGAAIMQQFGTAGAQSEAGIRMQAAQQEFSARMMQYQNLVQLINQKLQLPMNAAMQEQYRALQAQLQQQASDEQKRYQEWYSDFTAPTGWDILGGLGATALTGGLSAIGAPIGAAISGGVGKFLGV